MSTLTMDYRSYLRAELARRSTINPSYSLRAFARALSLAPGALSEILSGKRSLGPKKAIEITHKLALAPEEKDWFLRSLGRGAPKEIEKSNTESLPGTFDFAQFVDADTWTIVSDWTHQALWSLLEKEPKLYDLNIIANKFKVNADKLAQAVERMARAGLIKIHPEGELERVDDSVFAKKNFPADALRRLNRDLLIKAVESVEQDSADIRIVGSRTFLANRKKIIEAEERMKKFRNELMEFLQSGERNDQDVVYSFSTVLFPLDLLDRGGVQ